MSAGTAHVDTQMAADVPTLLQEAFKRITARDYEAARPMVERALELAPASGMAAHARMHLATDSCAIEDGAAFGLAFLAKHDPFDGINVHNAWHLAALLLEVGRPSAALQWQEQVVIPSVPAAPMTFYSAVSLLWRLEVYGHGRARGAALPWEPLHAASLSLKAATESPDIDDIGRAMTFIATGDDRNLDGLLARLRTIDRAERSVAAEVVVPVVLGLRAWWQQDYAAAVERLDLAGASFERVSQVPEQRVPLEDTLIDAQLRTGHFAAAEARLRQRLARQPRSLPRDLFWLARAQHAAGRREEAAATLRTVQERWKDAEPDAPEMATLQRGPS